MRKNISSLLQKGNLRPKERVLLLVADQVSKERDGKSILTEADKHALSKGWTPEDNNEEREYNRFNEGWKNAVFAELDAQTVYLGATISFLRASKYISYIIQEKSHDLQDKSFKNSVANKTKESLLEKEDEVGALNLVLGYLGLELDYTICQYAFELAGEELQKDLLALYPDVETERGCLDQEEIIADLFNGKDTLTKEAKEKLAELIANEQDTKLTHKEVFNKWLKVKAKATETIQGLIGKGELKTEKRKKEFKNLFKLLKEFDKYQEKKTLQENIKSHPLYIIENLMGQNETITETKIIITGESLYNLKGDFNFVKDFREQAEDFKVLGGLALFLKRCDFASDYAKLLGFLELFKSLSKTFETDLTYSIKKWIDIFREDLWLLKREFLMLGDDIMQANCKSDRVYYLSESYIEDLLAMSFNPDEIKPDREAVDIYFEKIKGILGDDF